jgi:hypothetical protein
MLRWFFSIFACLLGLSSIAIAASAPAQFYGKSIIVRWSENRVQRFVGEPSFHPATVNHELGVYISTAGRVFSRQINSGFGRTVSQDEVGGTAASPRITTAIGDRSLTIFIGRAIGPASGLRRVTVDFHQSWEQCGAQVVRVKQAGAASIVAMGRLGGRMIEIQSVSIPTASCAIRAGNVFASE